MEKVLLILAAGVFAQMGGIGAQDKENGWGKAILAHPLTAILACLMFGVLTVLGLLYLKRFIDRMREVEVIVKTKNIVHKETKALLKEETMKTPL